MRDQEHMGMKSGFPVLALKSGMMWPQSKNGSLEKQSQARRVFSLEYQRGHSPANTLILAGGL